MTLVLPTENEACSCREGLSQNLNPSSQTPDCFLTEAVHLKRAGGSGKAGLPLLLRFLAASISSHGIIFLGMKTDTLRECLFKQAPGNLRLLILFFILHFNCIFNLPTNVYILLCLFPLNLITAEQNVIALCALLQSSPPEEKESFTVNLTLNSLPSLPPSDKPTLSIFLEDWRYREGYTRSPHPWENTASSNCAREPFRRSQVMLL